MKLILTNKEIEFDNPEQLLNLFFSLPEAEQVTCKAEGLTAEVLDYKGIIEFDKNYSVGM